MRDTVKDGSANRDDAVSRKRTSSKDDNAPPAKRRVLTTARREQNRQAQKAYSMSRPICLIGITNKTLQESDKNKRGYD